MPAADEQAAGGLPSHVTLIAGTTAGGTGAHVRMLAARLARRGVPVTIAAPAAAGARFALGAVPGAAFTPVEIGDRPRPGDLAAIARLRRLLTREGRDGAGVAHAHGLRAGALTVLALTLAPARRPAVVVTVHNAPPAGGAAALVYRVLEQVTARGADLVLCVSGDLEERMRRAGARHVARAVIAADAPPAPRPAAFAGLSGDGRPADGRPVVLFAGRLAAQKGVDSLLDAAASWQDLEPRPLLVIAGDGPLAARLRDQAAGRGVDAAFLGSTGEVPALLAAAAVFVLPSRWEGQPLVLQEALRAGRPVVATRVGGVPALTGEEAALLVPPGDPAALAAAVRAVLTDPVLSARLAAAAAARAARLPSEAGAATAALSAYQAAASARTGRS